MNQLKNRTILYIDDEDAIRSNAVEYLQYYCDNVFEAKDGLEGYELYKRIKPDIIITDINMPYLNGLEMIQRIRNEDTQTKIIVATAYLETKYLLLAIELGLIKYLVKPITEDKLLPVLTECIKDFNTSSNIFQITGEHSFDRLNKTLFKNNDIIELTKKELDFLELLIKNHSRAVSYEEFNQAVWEGNMSEDAMRSIVKELRKKLSKSAIKNISKVGYQIQKIVTK